MEDARMAEVVAAMLGDSPVADLADIYLEAAKSAVVAHLFPYREDAEWADVPAKHHMRTCEIAVYLADKAGAEGQLSHSESGVSRTYASASVPPSMFDGMAPFVGVPR